MWLLSDMLRKVAKIVCVVILSAIIVVVFLYGFHVHLFYCVRKNLESQSSHTAEPHLATFLQRSIPTPMVPLPGLPEEQFTIVMQTYRREGLLRKVLPHYCNMSLVNRILVVWNNIRVCH